MILKKYSKFQGFPISTFFPDPQNGSPTVGLLLAEKFCELLRMHLLLINKFAWKIMTTYLTNIATARHPEIEEITNSSRKHSNEIFLKIEKKSNFQ